MQSKGASGSHIFPIGSEVVIDGVAIEGKAHNGGAFLEVLAGIKKRALRRLNRTPGERNDCRAADLPTRDAPRCVIHWQDAVPKAGAVGEGLFEDTEGRRGIDGSKA